MPTLYDALGSLSATTIVNETGTARTLATGDNLKTIWTSSSSDVVITVPSGLGSGFSCVVIQRGAGQVSFVAGSGATIHPSDTLKISARYRSATILAIQSNVFQLDGALSA